MIVVSSDPHINAEANQQIEYFVRHYSGADNPVVLRAKAEQIVKEALKTWNPSKGNIKTYLSSRLLALGRDINKRSPVYVPEKTLNLTYKIKRFIDEYADTHGTRPDASRIAKEMHIPVQQVKRAMGMVDGFGSIDNSSVTQTTMQTFDPLEHLDGEEKELAKLLRNNVKPTKIAQQFGVGKSTVYNRIKELKRKLARISEYKHMES